MMLYMDTEAKKLAMEYFQRAYEHQMRGELQEAVELYKKSIEAHPTAEAHTFLGWTYSFMGLYDSAIEECLKAIEVDPDFGNPYNDIGAYLIEKGQLDDAIPWLKKALQAKRYESYAFPHFNLGRIYEQKGLWFEAVREYRKAYEENPKFIEAARAMARLQGLLN